jgi:hypothetical protein
MVVRLSLRRLEGMIWQRLLCRSECMYRCPLPDYIYDLFLPAVRLFFECDLHTLVCQGNAWNCQNYQSDVGTRKRHQTARQRHLATTLSWCTSSLQHLEAAPGYYMLTCRSQCRLGQRRLDAVEVKEAHLQCCRDDSEIAGRSSLRPTSHKHAPKRRLVALSSFTVPEPQG